MNNYPEWWDRTITIYNRYEDKTTNLVKWYRTTVSNCFWKYVGEKVSVGEVVLDSNSIICRIPKDEKFLENYKWLEQPNDSKNNYFTLSGGDIIIAGEVSDEIDEYTAGLRSSDIIAKYKSLQGCMKIEQVSINVGAGRDLEHYLARGI